MSTNDQVVQNNKRNLERILNFPYAPSEPLSNNNGKTTTKALQQGSKPITKQQLERLLQL